MSLGEKDSNQVLGFLADKGDYYTKLAIIEKKRLADLTDAVNHIHTETENYRSKAKVAAIRVMNQHAGRAVYKRADGADIGKQALCMTSKMLTLKEVQLNKLCQRKSEILNYNNNLKLEIDHYRRMRLQTDISHAKFEATLKQEKEKIEEWLAESAAVVERRENLVHEKEKLEAMNMEEQSGFAEEYETIGMFIKQQNGALEEALLRERKAEKSGKGLDETIQNDNTRTTLTLQDEVEMARQVGNLSSFMANEKTSLSSIQDRIKMYEAMFDQLKKMTGATNLNEVVADYMNHEDEMFSLYNFIQTVNAEIEMVMDARNQTEQDIKLFSLEQSEQDSLKLDKLKELQSRLDSTREMCRQCEEQNAEMNEVVITIGKKVSTLFFKLQCDQIDSRGSQAVGGGLTGKTPNKSSGTSRPESKVALLVSQGVGEGNNVLEFMAFIEQRTVDVISGIGARIVVLSVSPRCFRRLSTYAKY
jgi:hypothetical protein